MRVAVTILVENTTPDPKLVGEYGFAALVEVDDYRFLFDTGSRDALFVNAKTLGIDLDSIRDVVISHGHFDHTGGLESLLRARKGRQVFIHPHAWLPKFVQGMWGSDEPRFIGMKMTREEVEKLGSTAVEFTTVLELRPGLLISGEIPRTNAYEDTGGKFLYRREETNAYETDLLPDDQAVFIDHPEGLIVISGCAHAGLVNTLDYALKVTGRSRVQAFIGGTHLMTAGEQRLEKTIEALESYDIPRMIVAHCTGFYAAARLYSRFGLRVQKGETGFRFQV